ARGHALRLGLRGGGGARLHRQTVHDCARDDEDARGERDGEPARRPTAHRCSADRECQSTKKSARAPVATPTRTVDATKPFVRNWLAAATSRRSCDDSSGRKASRLSRVSSPAHVVPPPPTRASPAPTATVHAGRRRSPRSAGGGGGADVDGCEAG